MSNGEKNNATNSLNAENDSILAFLSPFLVYPVAADDTPPYERIAWWKIIFSCLGLKKREQLELRWMCRIFHEALPSLPLWTSFPHPIYPTLNGLMDRLNHLGNDYVGYKAADISIGLRVYYDRFGSGSYNDNTITKINPDGTYNIAGQNNVPLAKLKQKVIHILPSLFLIADGVHVIDGIYVNINIPISIIGESREHCIVIGGLKMNGNEEVDVSVSDLTLRESKGNGVEGNGASIHLDNVSVEKSGSDGVSVLSSKRSTMKNCNVSHSFFSGLYVSAGGLMTIDGNATAIHHNGTCGQSSDYGLETDDSSSSIHLASSLNIETTVTNNGGGGNFGGDGTIAIVDNEGTIIETIQEATPEDDSEDDSEGDY